MSTPEERADDFPAIEQVRQVPQILWAGGHQPTDIRWLPWYQNNRVWPESLTPLTERENLFADAVERQAEEIAALRGLIREALEAGDLRHECGVDLYERLCASALGGKSE